MGEHVYLRRRDNEIRRLRFQEHRKLEQILVMINRIFPEQPIRTVGGLSLIIRRHKGAGV